MSIESAKDFYQRVSNDASFRELFNAKNTEKERQQLINDSGYTFTSKEWQQAITEIRSSSSNEELNEEELEAIAGGFGFIRDAANWAAEKAKSTYNDAKKAYKNVTNPRWR